MAPVPATQFVTAHLNTLVSRQNVAIPSSVITGVVAGVAVFFVIFFVGLGTWLCCHYKKPKNRGFPQSDYGAWRQSEDTLITSRWSDDSLGKQPESRPRSYDQYQMSLSRSSSDRPLDAPSEGFPVRPQPATIHSSYSSYGGEPPRSPGKVRRDRR